MAFSHLKLSAPILKALEEARYEVPTPIQHQAIPPILEGKDLLGIAQTGTGKTAAFALPLLDRLSRHTTRAQRGRMRVLILSPTRELSSQIHASFLKYGKHQRLSSAVIFGGVGQGPQVRALERGLDILVATPGRLLDLMQQGFARLDQVEAFVLDEADRMLDMGFIVPIRRIVSSLPAKRQTLMFSATMPDPIAKLAADLLHHPERIEITPVASTVDKVDQKVIHVDKGLKREKLRQLLEDTTVYQALVFTRTKRGADKVCDDLSAHGIRSSAINGNKSQGQRERALGSFRNGDLRVLVATDIAARGIDVPGVSLVVNYELPDEPESYVHRIGRTARAGREGRAVALCSHDERLNLRDIERLIGQAIPVEGAAPPPFSGQGPLRPEPRRQQGYGQGRPPRSDQRRHEPREQSWRGPDRPHRPSSNQSSGSGEPSRLEPGHRGHQAQRQGQAQGQGQGKRGRGRRGQSRRGGQGSSGQGSGASPQGSGFLGAIKRTFGL